jgi:hypothetical protein
MQVDYALSSIGFAFVVRWSILPYQEEWRAAPCGTNRQGCPDVQEAELGHVPEDIAEGGSTGGEAEL